jgi:Conserved TM helix
MTIITNWGAAIVSSLILAVNLMLTFIPRIIGFLLILLVGWLIATAISKGVVWLLRRIGFDNMANRIGLTRFDERMGLHLDPAGVLGKIVYWFILLIFLIPATDALGLPAVSSIINQLVAYIPNVFVAIIVLFLGTLAATFVADLVRGATASAGVGNPNIFANVARFAIIAFASLIALEQLQIAPALLNELFGGIVLALALAFGLAFGLGGRDSARRWLDRGENTISSAAAQISSQQRANPPQQGLRTYAPSQGQPQTQAPPQPLAQQPYAPPQSLQQPTSPQQGQQEGPIPSDYDTPTQTWAPHPQNP